MDVGGKISSEDSSGQKTTNHNGTESTTENAHQKANASSSEFEEVEQYGSYHLKFSVCFKSKDLSDTFLVGGPNARVILEGFSAPVLDTPTIAEPRKGDVALVLVSIVEEGVDGAAEVHFPTKSFLARPLSDFSQVRLVVGSLAELAQAAVYVPERVKGLRAEVEGALPSVSAAEALWKELIARYGAEKDAADTRTITLPGGATMVLCWCPPGSFTMGSPSTEQGRFDWEVQHPVTLTKGFWLGKYEVTQRQWESVMETNPAYFKSPDRPVEMVSWEDCQAFIRAVRRANPGLDVRLPTEAEWEYACRAGTTTALPNGRGLIIYGTNNGPALDDIAWYGGNSSQGFELSNGFDVSDWPEMQYSGSTVGTHPVGQKAANAWGLHDMIGNVWEWCEDWYNPDFREALNPVNTSSPKEYKDGVTYRVRRGGSWYSSARVCRSAYRDKYQPSIRFDNLGFRLCCSAGPRE